MTADLTLYAPPSASDLEQTWRLAERISRTEFVPTSLRGKPEAVLACVLAGRELGIGPMQALQSIHVIQGRPTMSADLMVGLVRRHGHRIRTLERTNDTVTVEGVRADDPGHVERITFTMADAQRAGLNGKDNWRQYPAAMLWARAVSALCRIAFNDVLHGVAYTPEELEPTATTTTVEAGPAEVVGILADGWDSHDAQNEAHRRLNVYLAENQLGSWFDHWLYSRGYQRPLTASQMEELRVAVAEIVRRRDVATQASGVGERVTPPPFPTAVGSDRHDPAPDPTSPSAPEQEEASELARSRAEGANQQGTTKPGAGTSPPGTTAPPGEAAATPRQQPPGGPNVPAGEGAKGARLGRSSVRGRPRDQGESHGSPAGRAPTTDEEEQALFEQALASDDPRRHAR